MNVYKIERYSEEFEKYSSIDLLIKIAFIKKLPNGEWEVVSHKGKNLGKYKTKSDALKRLHQIEFFKHKKSASKELSYSAIMRELNKSEDKETVQKFQKEFKKLFDAAILEGSDTPEDVLEEALKCIADDNRYTLKKVAAAVDLGDADFAGKYLSDLFKFLLKRISVDKRQSAINSLNKKVYYINEYSVASKKTPPSSSIGNCLSLLKTILLEHSPEYIRSVLNATVKHL